MAVDWSVVTSRHVEEACRLYDQGVDLPTAEARNTFLLLNDRRYPAKHIRGLAYRLATGRSLDPSRDYSGGMETVRFFNRREFEVEYKGRIYGERPRRESALAAQEEMRETSPRQHVADPQKVALRRLLEQLFGEVVAEQKFDWLVVPSLSEMDSQLMAIVDALVSYRGYEDFYSPGERLRVDFFVPSRNLIVEYDERQHFSVPRGVSLRHYPRELRVGFDGIHWASLCDRIRAVDNDKDKRCRDETRAFYDALRDILAFRHGIVVVRIKDGDFDWNKPNGCENLSRILEQAWRFEAPSVQGRGQDSAGSTGSVVAGIGTARIATVCVRGAPASANSQNEERVELLGTAVHAMLERRWSNMDAILLPGGFFFLDQYVGDLPFRGRVATLEAARFHNACKAACQRLGSGVFVVAGVDSGVPLALAENRWWGDQLCVAWSADGIIGIGRKVFPVSPPKDEWYDEEDDESLHYVCYETDYEADSRVIDLACGRSAMLCACYDMFGCAESTEKPTSRTRNIHYVSTGGQPLQVDHPKQRECVAKFQKLRAKRDVRVGLAAIHRFERPPKDVLWQRHGIAACSAALSGLAVGAAHYSERLPDVTASILAAADVPKTHLTLGHNRGAAGLRPSDGLVTDSGLLVRLFQW